MRRLFATFLLMACALSAAEKTAVDEAYRQMYNLEFADAHRTLAEWERSHPDDPMGPVSDAAAWLYSEFDRLRVLQSEYFVENHSFFGMHKLVADPTAKRKFEEDLAKTGELADRALKKSPNDENALLAQILRSGLHSDYLAMIEKKYMAALSEVKISRGLAERVLAAHPDLYDAYLAIGTENYLLSQKPAPVRWLLHIGGAETDKQMGIDKLRLTARKGRYLAPYARLILAVADLRDNDVAHARQELATLAAEFPHNHLYREELAKLRS